MSNTPLVKTIGRGSSARRGWSSARGQSLRTKAGSMRRLSRGAAVDSAHTLGGCDARALRILDLELLQQGQAGAAREGHRVHRGVCLLYTSDAADERFS